MVIYKICYYKVNITKDFVFYYVWFRFLLCVNDIYRKHAMVAPLKEKKLLMLFKKILDESNYKPIKIWVDKGNELQ